VAYQDKVGSLAAHAQSLVQGCLVMLESMEEIDSKVKIMRLLSLTFEGIGDRAQELLSLVADFLPRVSASTPFLVPQPRHLASSCYGQDWSLSKFPFVAFHAFAVESSERLLTFLRSQSPIQSYIHDRSPVLVQIAVSATPLWECHCSPCPNLTGL